jgi:hypothetical protein
MNRGFLVLVDASAPGRRLPLSSGAHWSGRASWQPAGLVEVEGLADAMAQLLRERRPNVDIRVVPLNALAAEVGYEEAERILDRLRNPTTAETARAHELEREAAASVSVGPGAPAESSAAPPELETRLSVERRSGLDRRRGDRRKAAEDHAALANRSVERREAVDRRSGVDRRDQQPLSLA